MKRIFFALLMSACTTSSSSSPTVDTATASAPAPSAPIASASAAPSASAPLVKGHAAAPSSLSFCKGSDFGAEPLLELCAIGQDWSKAHFECKKPLPVNFCADLSVWGCQYVAVNGEKPPRVSFEARFVRPGVALSDGEIINDDGLRARFPRAGVVRGASVRQKVSGNDEGMKVSAAETKKLIDAGCVVNADESGWSRLDCGSWQAQVAYVNASSEVRVDADMPTSPDCTK